MKKNPPIDSDSQLDNVRIEFTAWHWTNALGVHSDTFQRRINEAGLKYAPHEKIPAVDIVRAFGGKEKERAITLKYLAEAEAKQMENAIARKELLRMTECEKIIWSDCLAPLRSELEQLPKTHAQLCNPQDPATAEKVLEQWKEGIKLKIIEPKNKE